MKRAGAAKKARAARPAPEIVVLSRLDAEAYEPRDNEICISIFDPDAEPARVSSQFTAVLRLSFDDVTQMGEPTDILFARDHADAISRFIGAWPAAERVVIHCNMGVSRSPGVALGLCDWHGWATAELERSHPGWNRLVRTVMRESAARAEGSR
jgi:predicted protein tyrosine phosphatase